MTRTSTFSVRSAPSGSNSRSCSTRSSFDCSAGLIVPISSRKIVPPSASANLPFLVVVGAGERAADVAEQLRLEQRLGDRRAVDLDERHVALRAAVVNGARDELLAGAGLAGDEHRALGIGDALGPADDLLHRPAAADDAVVVELFVALAAQVAVLGAQPLVIERAADDDQQLVDLERLLQVVERAELHRLDRALDRGVRGHHQDLGPLALGRRADVLADQVEAAQLRHDVVDDEEVERPLGQQPLASRGLRRLDHLVAGVAQRPAERLEDLLFVVDEQDRAAVCHQR